MRASVVACCIFLLLRCVTFADDFKTVDGREYKNATVNRIEPDGIVLITSSGIAKVYFAELPKEVQERFHYDPEQAAARRSRIAEAEALLGHATSQLVQLERLHQPIALLLGIVIALKIGETWLKGRQRQRRRSLYLDEYLKSENWESKRVLALKRDGYCCVYCGVQATQVHHKRYAPQNIGREPIEWLVSVCDRCHRKRHRL